VEIPGEPARRGVSQVKSFCRQNNLSASSSRMRYGAGGWMGLGGMWGGFGW